MAIKSTTVAGATHQSLTFKLSELALKYCVGQGIELGAAAHNPFGLPGSANLAPEDDFEFYKVHQIAMNGQFAEVDFWGEADNTDLLDASQDYVISSHTVEHLPNVIGAFLEWNRILKPGGIIFMIVPHRNAHPPDASREISSVGQIVMAHEAGWTSETVPADVVEAAGGNRGHIWVFTLERMLELIAAANAGYALNWEIVMTQEVDDKVGNGFTVVARFNPPVTPDLEVKEATPEKDVEPAEIAEAGVEAAPVEAVEVKGKAKKK